MLKWVQKEKQPNLRFELQEQTQPLIEMIMESHLAGQRAVCKCATSQFKIAFDGFWRHKVLVRDMSDTLVALVYAESWHSDTSILKVNDKLLRMKIRNNPLAELIVFEDEVLPLVAYRLVSSTAGIRALDNSSALGNVEVHEDVGLLSAIERETILGIAWFLFYPIAQEQCVEFAR